MAVVANKIENREAVEAIGEVLDVALAPTGRSPPGRWRRQCSLANSTATSVLGT